MDIYEFAMQMERDGENYYRELADQCDVVGLQKIFTMLADEEVKHYEVVKRLKEEQSAAPELGQTRVMANVKNIFLEMKEEKPEMRTGTTEQTNAYRKARDIEDRSQKFYLEKAGQAEGERERLICQQLAREEGKHLRIMEDIIEFVSRPEPGNWLEDAEWNHLEDY